MNQWKQMKCNDCDFAVRSSMTSSAVCKRFPPSIKRESMHRAEKPHYNPIDYYPIVVADIGAAGIKIQNACSEFKPVTKES